MQRAMWWWIAIAIAGAIALWPALVRGGLVPGAEPPAPPTIVKEPPINPDTGEPLGSPADIAHNNAQWVLDYRGAENQSVVDALATIGSLTAAGAGIGSPILPPIGSVIGALVGAFVGFIVAAINQFEANKNWKPPPPLPVREMGLPYRPDLAARTQGGGIVVTIPQVVNKDRVSAGGSNSVTISGRRLAEMFPGAGAVDACIRSGMCAWRPFDIANPFTAELLRIAPLLLDYDHTFIRRTPEDYQFQGEWVRWSDLAPLAQTDRASHLLVLQSRRLAAWREMRLPERLTVRATAADAGFSKFVIPESPSDTVLVRRDVGNWLAWDYAKTIDSARKFGWLMSRRWFADQLDVREEDRRPAVVRYSGDASSLREIGGDWRQHVTPSGLGFPGAWRLAPAAWPETLPRHDRPSFRPATQQSLLDVLHVGSMDQLLQTLEAQIAHMLAFNLRTLGDLRQALEGSRAELAALGPGCESSIWDAKARTFRAQIEHAREMIDLVGAGGGDTSPFVALLELGEQQLAALGEPCEPAAIHTRRQTLEAQIAVAEDTLATLMALPDGRALAELEAARDQTVLELGALGDPKKTIAAPLTGTLPAAAIAQSVANAQAPVTAATVRSGAGLASIIQAAKQDRAGPDPAAAFQFQVWLHTGPATIGSWRFLDAFGSHAQVRQALEAGQVAWHPIDNAPAVREVWARFDPTLPTVARMFEGWRPFTPELTT